MFDVIPFICLVLCFLNVWVWMKSTCKDNIWMVGSVYNHNNVPLDVDPKCIFVVQIYYRVLFFPFFQKWIVQLKQFVWCLGWGWWRCYILPEIAWSFHQIIKSDFTSALSVFFFFFLIVGIFLVSKWKGAFWWFSRHIILIPYVI